ncbi:tail sheath stabilizer and completion protein [Xanthomonas phage XaC1]|nr:tail sheath stabilizer and completion protein [Xanthomonas phage XaC1]
MKLDYFYDEQFRRVLKHLIRVFGEFQVQNGVDSENNVKYRKVPCLYADMSRQAQYNIANSENILNSAPFMTISVKSLNINRKEMRAPVSQDVILGKNKQDESGNYTSELDTIHHVKRYNPVPWTFEFDVNIWTTTLTNKMELIEQIATIFNPSIQLQLSTNPLDWTSLSTVELIGSEFSTRAVPQGTDSDLDIAKLTFTTQIYFSLPAIDQRALLINQIVTNIGAVRDEQELIFDPEHILTEVFTPKNFSIKVDKLSQTNSLELYELTLMNSNNSEVNDAGKIYDWNKYLNYLEPDYKDKQLSIKFQTQIEEDNPMKGMVVSIGSGKTSNKLQVELDSSQYQVKYTVDKFIIDDLVLHGAPEGSTFVYIGDRDIDLNYVILKPNDIVFLNNGIWEVLNKLSPDHVIYNAIDQLFYRFDDEFGWYRTVLSTYRPGYWRIGFTEI